MDKNKQTKRRKLKTKLISIAILAIILVSMLAVPTSAAIHEDDYYTGEWIINNISGAGTTTYNFGYDVNDIDLYIVVNGEIESADCYSLECKMNSAGDPSSASELIFIVQLRGISGRYANFYSDRIEYLVGNTVQEIVYEDDPRYEQLRTIQINQISNARFRDFLDACAEKIIPPEPKSVLGNILDVFLGIGGWIATAVTSLIGIFYSAEAGKLTVIGVLSVASLAISVIFLLIGVIQNFMHFRS